jgi:DNA-binding response OmpR family regulator
MRARVSLGRKTYVTNGIKKVSLWPSEATLLWALMTRPRLTLDEAISLIWPMPDHEPDWPEVGVRVRICMLRKKLAEMGIFIQNQQRGWALA